MRYKGYAVSYADEQLKVNKENFFVNGICRENLDRMNVFQMNRDFGRRNFYAVTSGAKCDEDGDELSQVAVDVLKGFYGSDFAEESRSYFSMANSAITGNVFERKNSHFEVDISLLYIENDIATVYSFGDMPAFYYQDGKLKNLSGQSPSTVEIEKVVHDNKGTAHLQKFEKQNIPYIGYFGEECESVPYVSESIKLKHKGFFVLCSKSVTDVIGEETIKEILADTKIKGSNKATYIIDRAVKKQAEGNYTVLVVQVENGIPVAEAEVKSVGGWALVALLCAVLYFTSPFILSAVYEISEGTKTFIGNLFDTEEEPSGDLKWTPKEETNHLDETAEQNDEITEQNDEAAEQNNENVEPEEAEDAPEQSRESATPVTERSDTNDASSQQTSSTSSQETIDESDEGQTSETAATESAEVDEEEQNVESRTESEPEPEESETPNNSNQVY